MDLDLTAPVPSPLWLVHAHDRPSSYLGKVYARREDALRAKSEDEVVVELRLAPTVSESR